MNAVLPPPRHGFPCAALALSALLSALAGSSALAQSVATSTTVAAATTTTTVVGTAPITPPPVPSVDPAVLTGWSAARLSNMSVRSKLGANEILIVGFTFSGAPSSTNRMLMRAAGPTLAQYGVTDAMPNPKLRLTTLNDVTLAENDDWQVSQVPVTISGGSTSGSSATGGATATGSTAWVGTVVPIGNVTTSGSLGIATIVADNALTASTTFASVGAFAFGAADTRSASLTAVLPAIFNYTVLVSGSTPADTGTVLAELYDVRQSADTNPARLVNLSVRGNVDAGAGLIGGFVVDGPAGSTIRLLVRVAGPTLTRLNVPGAIVDPKLDVMDVNGNTLASNDNWGEGSASEVADRVYAIQTTGAFPFSSATSKDAACVVSLPPGLYTVRATGVGGVTGAAVLEVYELPTVLAAQ